MVKNLRAARPRAKWKIEAPIIIVLSTSKKAAVAGSTCGTSGGPSCSAATAAAAEASPARSAGESAVAEASTAGTSVAPCSSPDGIGSSGTSGDCWSASVGTC